MTRIRPTWPDLPPPVRAGIENAEGARVTSWTSHDGGYSPGWALTLNTTAGDVFVKVAGSEHPETMRLHRAEAVKSAALPDGVPAPRSRWTLDIPDDDGARTWVVIASDVVPGRAPRTEPWDVGDLDLLGRLAHRIAEHTVPDDAGAVFPAFADKAWPHPARLAAQPPAGLATYDPWLATNLERVADLASPGLQAAALAGDRLVHNDLRADNVLVVVRDGGEEGVAVDWPHATRGAAFLDQAGLLPSVTATGGPTPAEALARVPFPAGTDEDAATVWVAVMTCYFVWSSLQDPPPGIPHLRAFQRAQGEAALAWLRERLREV